MAPPKVKGAASRSNPSAPSRPEDPLDDHDGTSYAPDLEDELARLREALAAAQDRIVPLEQGNPAAAVPPVAAPPVVVAAPPVVPVPPVVAAPIATRSAPTVNKPAEFNGKLSEYNTFISQCLLAFTMYPTAYGEDKEKVLFVISYLSGTPRRWANRILLDPDHAYLKDFGAFKKALDAMYSDRNLKQKARDQLGQLEQTKSVAAYAAEFQETVMPLDLEDDSLMSRFYQGLNSGI